MHMVLSAECRNALGRVAVFSSPSNRALVFGLRFFDLPTLSTQALYTSTSCIVSGDHLIRDPAYYVTAHTC